MWTLYEHNLESISFSDARLNSSMYMVKSASVAIRTRLALKGGDNLDKMIGLNLIVTI